MSLFGGKKRDESGAAAAEGPATPGERAGAAASAASADQHNTSTTRAGRALGGGGQSVANMGKSIIFKGELSGDEDLELEGQVEGLIQLANHQVTIGAHARVKAEVNAKNVIVVGHVVGNVSAAERIEIQASGVVEGNLHAPKLLVQEGAVVNGAIDMSSPSPAGRKPEPTSSGAKPGSGDSARKAG